MRSTSIIMPIVRPMKEIILVVMRNRTLTDGLGFLTKNEVEKNNFEWRKEKKPSKYKE